jgi:phage-related minor tail protein
MKEFQNSMKEVSANLQKAGKEISDVGKGMTKYITAPALAAGGALFALAQKTANAGDEIQKMGLRTGFSTETLSELRHAANLSGTSIQSLETGIKRMQKVVFDAEKGMGSATESLEALGIAFSDLQGLNPEEQFNRLTIAIAEIEDPTKRAALAQEIFGRSGTEMLPMLADGAEGLAQMRAEAHELGIVFSQDTADAAAQFNDDMLRLKQGIGGAFQELGMKLIPIMVDEFIPAIRDNIIPLVKGFIDGIINLMNWFRELDPTWQTVITTALGFLIALGPLLIIIGKIIAVVGTITGMLPVLGTAFTFLTGPIGLVIAAIAAAIAIGVLLYKNWDEIKAKAKETWESITSGIKGYINSIIGFINGLIRAFETMVNSVARAINSLPSISIPDWVPVIGGRSFSFPRVNTVTFSQIPVLHDGGVFKAPQPGGEGLALLKDGENVTPAGKSPEQRANIYIELDGVTIAQLIGEPLVDEIRIKTGLAF